MTSLKQIAANRRNAAKSTGPRTEEGKQRSRRNAVRHGLTAETVIGAMEDAEDYAPSKRHHADYTAQSAVERELVLRLASLLWRLRRATTIETGLFEIQAENLSELTKDRSCCSGPASEFCTRFFATRRLNPTMRRHLRPLSVTSKRKSPSTQLRPIHPLTLPVLFCGSRIYRIAFSIVSAAMKPRSGGKRGRHLSHLTP